MELLRPTIGPDPGLISSLCCRFLEYLVLWPWLSAPTPWAPPLDCWGGSVRVLYGERCSISGSCVLNFVVWYGRGGWVGGGFGGVGCGSGDRF